MEPVFDKELHDGSLVWLPELGWGYVNPDGESFKYDENYFETYVGRRDTEMGKKLTDARVKLVNCYLTGEVVDIGIGAGAFVESRGADTYGFDINQTGIDWLEARGLFVDPYKRGIYAATFWDSLEHIPQPQNLLTNIRSLAFVSMPIYRNVGHVLTSKHFKKGEHIYYFTRDGLIEWMSRYGFRCLEENNIESDLGREDIGTFVFRRKRS